MCDVIKSEVSKLNHIKEQVEAMSKFNQLEILKILVKNKNIVINENKYGIHVNLSQVDELTLEEIASYVQYVSTQEMFLNGDEQEKEKYKNTFFGKDNKDIST
jgi:hypothetical protein